MRRKYWWNEKTQMMEPWETHQAEPKIHIIDDTMPETVHPSTGDTYTSKHAFRRVTKARGLEEVGNEWNNKPIEFFQRQKSQSKTRERLIEWYRKQRN